MAFSTTFDAGYNVHFFEILTFHIEILTSQSASQAQVVAQTVSSVGKDLIIVGAKHLHVAGRNPAVPVFPSCMTVIMSRDCFANFCQSELDITQLIYKLRIIWT